MRALTLTEPWATLMMLGAKKIETRSWKLPDFMRGQQCIIHSARNMPRWAFDTCREEPFYSALRPLGNYAYPELNRGKGLCVVRFLGWKRTEDVRETIDEKERAFGDYGDDRYAWMTEYVERWGTPSPAVGHLGFWDWNASMAKTIGALARS